MIFGDYQSIQTIIKTVTYRYTDVKIRFTFFNEELIFTLRRGDKYYEYHIPSYDLISLYPTEITGKLITIIEDKLIDKNPLTTTECINRILSDALCKPMVKKIIKSGPCTIVIWEDKTKTIVRLREGEKDDEFAAFSAAVVKKLYGSNSAVSRMIKKKTFVQEKKEG